MVQCSRFAIGPTFADTAVDSGMDNIARPTAAGCTATVSDSSTPYYFAQEMHRLPEQRRQLIFRIRRQIAEGVYDTDQKLEVAMDRAIDRLSAEPSAPGGRLI